MLSLNEVDAPASEQDTGSVLTLYAAPASVNSHRARLILRLLGLPFEEHAIDLLAGQQRQPSYLAVSPTGQVPALRDGTLTIFDSHAIALYLCDRHDAQGLWLPREPAERAQILQWLFFDANDLHNGFGYARNAVTFGVPTDLPAAQRRARASLQVLSRRLDANDWLALSRPTLADVACYPMLSVAAEAGVSLAQHAQVVAWLARVEALPGVAPMPAWSRPVRSA